MAKEVNQIEGFNLFDTKAREEIQKFGSQLNNIANEIGRNEDNTEIDMGTIATTIRGAIKELKDNQGGSGLDLSSLTVTTETVSEGTKLLLTDETTTKEVTIPSATETQVKSVIEGLIADGTLSSITLGDNSVQESNIQDGVVSEKKLSFIESSLIEETSNKFDTNLIEWGSYSTDGTTIKSTSTDFGITNYIEIIPNTDITINHVQAGLSNKVFYYDKDKNYLGFVTWDTLIQVTDENAKYIRFNANKNNLTTIITTTQYIDYKVPKNMLSNIIDDTNINNSTSYSSEKIDKLIPKKVLSQTIDVDVFTLENSTDGLLYANGSIVSSDGFKVTDYIEIIPNTDITASQVNPSWPCILCYYDKDKNYLGYIKGTVSGSETVQVTDENAKYIRYSVATAYPQSLIIKVNIIYYILDSHNTILPISKDNTLNSYTTVTGQAVKNFIYSINFNVTKWRGKKIIVDGDSITHNGTWHTYLKEWFELDTVYNHACSGNTLTKYRGANDASGVGNGLTGVERVKQNYEDDADAIILMGDGNDFGTVGIYSDTSDDTWCGRMNLMLDAIIEKYPTIPIILISNPPRNDNDGYKRNGLGGLYDEQAKAMKDLAYNRNLYYIDCYHTNIYRPWNTDNVTLYGNNGTDTVHLNTLGHKLMAQMIFEELKKVGIDF